MFRTHPFLPMLPHQAATSPAFPRFFFPACRNMTTFELGVRRASQGDKYMPQDKKKTNTLSVFDLAALLISPYFPAPRPQARSSRAE